MHHSTDKVCYPTISSWFIISRFNLALSIAYSIHLNLPRPEPLENHFVNTLWRNDGIFRLSTASATASIVYILRLTSPRINRHMFRTILPPTWTPLAWVRPHSSSIMASSSMTGSIFDCSGIKLSKFPFSGISKSPAAILISDGVRICYWVNLYQDVKPFLPKIQENHLEYPTPL